MASLAARPTVPAQGLRPGALDPRVAVGIATRGRPEYVRLVVEHLRLQTLPPAKILIACVEAADVEGLAAAPDLVVIASEPGLTRQRNAILDQLPGDCQFIVFFDDDFFPQREWLARAIHIFGARPEIACITGHVIANGICGPNLSPEDALGLLEAARPDDHDWFEENISPYGCNMAFRRSAVGALRFDEQLVQYGWLEDRDFGARVERQGGRLIKVGAALGVHLGVASARMSDRKLGYAQIANPLHLLFKRTMSPRLFALRVLTDLGSNVHKAPRSRARRLRLVGNLIAIAEALVGLCKPERAARLR
jgi:glycosyltransferase involved in cell wall biosynthesis